MTSNVIAQNGSAIGSQKYSTLVLIGLLLSLRYLVTASRVLIGEPLGWLLPVFEVGTYLLVAIFLILNISTTQDYHITGLALWLILVFKPIETLILARWEAIDSQSSFALAFPKIPALLIWAMALGLLFILRKRLFRKGSISKKDWTWLLTGLLAGLGNALILAYPMSFVLGQANPVSKAGIIAALLGASATIPYQIGYAAVTEEPVFRGFLWGYLRKSGWRDVWIWLFQAALFSLAHLYYLKSAPLMFWFGVPLGGLVLGWLAWRTRSIATSMAAHGVVNGLSRTLEFVFAALRG